MKEKRFQNHFYNWVPGIITLLALSAVYAVDGFFPFGTGSVAALDLNTQYLPLLYKFYDTVKGISGVTVDFRMAGGVNLYSEVITELINPFNYVLLLFEREHLYLAVNLLPVLYSAAASVTAAFALGRFSRNSFVHIILSVCYGLSFYNAYQFEIIRWMYLVVLFPLFAVSLKNLLEEEKVLGYTLLLAYQLILSMQLGFQTCLFTFCAAICYLLYMRTAKKERQEDLRISSGTQNDIGRTCLLLGCATAAALMISAVNLLPALYNVLHSARFQENQALIFVISQHGLDDLLERLLEVGHPVVIGMLTGVCILRHGRARREERAAQPGKTSGAHRRYTRMLLLLLLATVVLQPSNLLWHLGYYQCFPVRYGYMVLFLLISMTSQYSTVPGKSSDEPAAAETVCTGCASAVSGSGIFAAAAFIITVAALGYAVANRLMFSYAFATLAISRVCIKETLLFYGLMICLAASATISYVLMETAKCKRAAIYGGGMLLAAAAAAGAVCYLCVLFPQGFEARIENEKAYRSMSEWGNERTAYSSLGHINDEESLLLNEPLVSGRYSMTSYMPAGADMGFSKAMDDLGYSSPWISVRSEGGTVISDVLLGIHNPYVTETELQNGIFLSDEAYRQMPEGTGGHSSMLVQQGILRAMCSETSLDAAHVMQLWGKSFGRQDKAGQDGDTVQSFFETISQGTLQISAAEPLLVYARTAQVSDHLLVNGKLLEKEAEHQSQNYNRIYFLGKFEQEKVVLSAVDENGNPISSDAIEVAVVRLHAFEQMCEELADRNRRAVEPDERHGKLHVYSEDARAGVLLLPFAYLKGYRAEDAAGQPIGAVQVSSFLGGLMQLHMAEPVSEITLVFSYEILKPALWIAVAGMLFLLLVLLLQSLCASKRFTDGSSGLAEPVLCRMAKAVFVLTAILFLLAVYVLPNLGLAGYMAGKLCGRDILEVYREREDNSAEDTPVLLQAQLQEDGIHVVMAGKNLVTSLGARLSADTVESKAFSPQKAGDGIVHDANSRWSSENNWEDANHFLQADLKKRQTIRALRIFWFQKNASSYEIAVSDDKSFADSTVVARFSEAPASGEQVIYLEAPVEARYLRIAVRDVNKREEDLSLYYQNISIEELEIYGDDSVQFVIEPPVLTGGTGREIPVPEVPSGYALSVGGVNYRNLMADENHLTDTCAPVKINLGYVLTCGRATYDLPGFELILPASDAEKTGNEADLSAVSSAGNGMEVCGVSVREWKPAGGICHVSANLVHEMTDAALQKELGEEGYRIEISENAITLAAAGERGLCWAHVTLEQMTERATQLPCGIIRDYPAYPVRGFCMDVARRPIPMEMLYEMVDALSAEKMNTLQLHLNDNAIIAESEYDGTVEGARALYSAFRLESNMIGETGEGLTAGDLYYTKDAFRELVEYAQKKGVEIVPEIDTPAHSMAFTKIMPSLGYKNEPEMADTLDIGNPGTLSFVEGLWGEYLLKQEGTPSVFEKCKTVHLGMDEFYGKPDLYEAYLTGLTERVREMAPDKTIRIWGRLSDVGADFDKVPKDVEWMIWSLYWANPKALYDAGFKIINCLNSDLYIITGSGSDHLDVEGLSQSWQPNRFADGQSEMTLPAWSDRVMGACYAMWNDHYTKGIDNTSEADLMERFEEPLHTIAERLW